MKIGFLTKSVSRQNGGLLGSVSSMALSLRDCGAAVSIFSGHDADTASDLRYWRGLEVHTMRHAGPASYGYLPALARILRAVEPDLLHTHGLWMYPSVAGHRWRRASGRPLMISPHGMLNPWALRNAVWKKRLAAALYEDVHLRGASCLHALCESEYQAIRAYGLRNPVALIPNGVDLPDLVVGQEQASWRAGLPPAAKALLFLGRLHPIKGLPGLLHAWSYACQTVGEAASRWYLVIAGWDQCGHQAELEALVADLGIISSVCFIGPQFDEQKSATLAGADAFVLPSLSEALPMAVLEAWSYRLPVLMTPQCNLPEGLSANAALLAIPDVPSLAAALLQLFEMSETDRSDMGDNGRALVEAQFSWTLVGQKMIAVYRWLLGYGSRPDCVLLD